MAAIYSPQQQCSSFLKSRRLCTDHVKTRQDQNVAYQYIEVPIFFLLFYELAQPRSTPIWDKSIGTSPSVSTNQTRVNSKIRWCARFPWTVEHIPAFKMVHSMHDQAKDPGFSSSVALKMSNCTNFPTPLLYYYFIFALPLRRFDLMGLVFFAVLHNISLLRRRGRKIGLCPGGKTHGRSCYMSIGHSKMNKMLQFSF